MYAYLNISHPPSTNEIISAYSLVIPDFDINNFYMSREEFTSGILLLLVNNELNIDSIYNAINKNYINYNETEILLIMSEKSS